MRAELDCGTHSDCSEVPGSPANVKAAVRSVTLNLANFSEVAK